MPRRLKILISAYACSPIRGSEPGVGWGFITALAKYHDFWVITEKEKFQTEIEEYLQENEKFADKVNFYFIQKKRNRPLRKIWPPSYYWYYRKWHWRAYKKAQQLQNEVGFDIVHQLTMVGFREPGYLWKLGIPFVWGPVGGMGLFPLRFWADIGLKGYAYYLGYNLVNILQMRYSRRARLAARFAKLITATPENKKLATQYWQVESEVISEVGLPTQACVTAPVRRTDGEPLNIIWSGQHIARKALGLGLKALSVLPGNVGYRLHILGRGAMTNHWQHLASKLGIVDRCIFYGWLPRKQALGIMQTGHLMLITSLRDLTSTVTVEALAMGLPVICLDHCGFSHVINETCGFKVPVVNPSQVAGDIASRLMTLYGDEALRYKLANGALQRAMDFNWDKKALAVDKIYRQALIGK